MPTPVVINTEADEMSQNENKHPVDDQLFSTNPREGSTSRSPSKDAIGFSPPKSSSRKVEGNNTTMITSRSPSGSQSKFEDENFNQSLKPLSVSKIYCNSSLLCRSMSFRSVVEEEMESMLGSSFIRDAKELFSCLQ